MSDARWARVDKCYKCWRVYRRKGHKDYCPVVERDDHSLLTLHPDCPLPRLADIPEVRALREAGTRLCRIVDETNKYLDGKGQPAIDDWAKALAAFDKGDKGEEK